jgi:hypothetical protein
MTPRHAGGSFAGMLVPRERALAVVLTASLLALSVQHALYLCGMVVHESPQAGSAPCHDDGTTPKSVPSSDRGAPCCGTASLASLPSGRDSAQDLVPSLSLGMASAGLVSLAASASARLERRETRPASVPRLRSHIALGRILV